MPELNPFEAVQTRLAQMQEKPKEKDPITRILRRGTTLTAEQTFTDLVTAYSAASRSNTVGAHLAGRPGKSVGELMNALKAQRIEEAEKIARIEQEAEQLAETKRNNLTQNILKSMELAEKKRKNKTTEQGQVAERNLKSIDTILEPYSEGVTKGTFPAEKHRAMRSALIKAVAESKAITPLEVQDVASKTLAEMGIPELSRIEKVGSSLVQIRPKADGTIETRRVYDGEAVTRPGYLDETGRVKREAVGELRRNIITALGAQQDEAGRVLGLTPKQQAQFPKLLKRAEERLRDGKSDGIADAVADTLEEMPPARGQTLRDRAEQIISIMETPPNAPPENASSVYHNENTIRLRLEDATGILSGLKDTFLNNFIGQFFSDVTDPNVVRARQAFGLLVNDWIIANKRSPRLPVFEQIRLNKIFSEPSIWRSPEVVRNQMKLWRDDLTREINAELVILEDLRLAPKEAQASMQSVREMARVRAALERFELDSQTEGFFDFATKIPEKTESQEMDMGDFLRRKRK